jgi:integrase
VASIDRWQGKRWRARWRDPDGRQRTKVFNRKVDAEQFLTSVQHRVLMGEYVDPNAGRVTVKEWCERWRGQQVHRASTQVQVETSLRRHVYPSLGARELRSLRPSDVQAWVQARAQVLAPGTVEVVYRHLASALKAAERDRIIGRSPCQGIRLPKATPTELVVLTTEQVAALADAIAPRYRVAVVLGAGAGLRLGEVLGLHVDRVDFLRRQLRVDQQLVTLGGAPPQLCPPKTASSVRTVPLADVVVEELAEHVRKFPPADGLVVTTALDAPVRRSTFHPAWDRARKAAGVEGVRFHDLRHHFASVLIAGGCSVKAVQAALGHASAVETLETYAHLWPSDEDRTRDAIQAALTGSSCVTDVSRAPVEGGQG